MSKRKVHFNSLPDLLTSYAQLRGLDFQRYSEFHMRLMDGGFCVLDVWTTGKYFVLVTDYSSMGEGRAIERGGEKGWIPTEKTSLNKWLDKFFSRSNYCLKNNRQHKTKSCIFLADM